MHHHKAPGQRAQPQQILGRQRLQKAHHQVELRAGQFVEIAGRPHVIHVLQQRPPHLLGPAAAYQHRHVGVLPRQCAEGPDQLQRDHHGARGRGVDKGGVNRNPRPHQRGRGPVQRLGQRAARIGGLLGHPGAVPRIARVDERLVGVLHALPLLLPFGGK
ncbi:MAG: hypothetical protein R2851_18685 [Caldilineaceae bacterium]